MCRISDTCVLFFEVDMAKKEFLGVAMATLMDDDTTELPVWIPELNPFVEGDPSDELNDSANVINLAPNTKGNASIKAVSTVLCVFYCKPNVSRPNVHVGEHVVIYEYNNNGQFFWDVVGTDDKLRTTECVKIHVASKPNQKDPLSPQSTYYFEMDSREGQRHVLIHTSQFNGEKVGYDIKVDLDTSIASLVDTEGNSLSLESLKKHWNMTNGNGDFIDMIPDLIHINTATLKVNASKLINLISPAIEAEVAASHFTGTIDADKIIKSLIDCISAAISGVGHKHPTAAPGSPSTPI